MLHVWRALRSIEVSFGVLRELLVSIVLIAHHFQLVQELLLREVGHSNPFILCNLDVSFLNVFLFDVVVRG